jgi:TolA-binding protein
MIKLLLLITLLFTTLSAEKSAFGAGSIDSENPYGLTESEKIIFENKKQIRYQNQKISELSEQIEGMRSVVESMGMKLGKTGARINELNSRNVEAQDSEIHSIKSEINDLKRVQSENYKKINGVLKKLSTMIDKINTSYISQSDLDAQLVKKKPTKKSKISKLTNSQQLEKAVEYYRKNFYTKAKPILQGLADKNYKPAKSNYYLGEISYYQKRYSDAIVYYKKSAGYYDKASYMPVLYLHTGLAFEKLNDIENKKRFLNALISTYPNTKEAKIAKDYL